MEILWYKGKRRTGLSYMVHSIIVIETLFYILIASVLSILSFFQGCSTSWRRNSKPQRKSCFTLHLKWEEIRLDGCSGLLRGACPHWPSIQEIAQIFHIQWPSFVFWFGLKKSRKKGTFKPREKINLRKLVWCTTYIIIIVLIALCQKSNGGYVTEAEKRRIRSKSKVSKSSHKSDI